MSELISGKEAKLAWAEGVDVQVATGADQFRTLASSDDLGIFDRGNYFRLKPKTITINGIEVPRPQKDSPKKGDDVFTLDFTNSVNGFTSWRCQSSINTFEREWWRSEEEIKQVIAALRSVFNTK